MNRFWWLIAALAAPVGLGLIAHGAFHSSATYDEPTYMRVAATWWRTGEQDTITRMGSPITFWKLQQAPTFWVLDRIGRGGWIDDIEAHQAEILPWLRIGASWVWLVAWGLTVGWSASRHGPRAAALAAWLFALGPNLLAHGGLILMEMPIAACTVALLWLYERRLLADSRNLLAASGLLCGLAFSCKFTAILFPPLLATIGAIDRYRRGHPWRDAARRFLGDGLMLAVAMLLTDIVITGGALIPASPHRGGHPFLSEERFGPLAPIIRQVVEIPLPQDLVGFAGQMHYQRMGGPSYLLGEYREQGWRTYYLIALAVKVSLASWALIAARLWFRGPSRRLEGMPVAFAALFLLICSVFSTRNYGIRYLLPIAPGIIVWVSALAVRGRVAQAIALLGVIAQGLVIASIHPDELTYFNSLAGGRQGGRHVLSDSNLDWGQGARALARLQAQHPEFKDITFFAFCDTDPRHYGVVGKIHEITAVTTPPDLPDRLSADTPYIAVSASLQWGPWGPRGYFEPLNSVEPIAMTDDGTIAIYRTPREPRPN